MIALTNVSKFYGEQRLFVDASFQLNPGDKAGLIGPNGSGKTTIFRMITGEEAPDEGVVARTKQLTVGYFRQDVGDLSGRSVLEETIAGAGDGKSTISYDADGDVGGLVAGVGQRVLMGVAKHLTRQFFTALKAHFTSP